MGLFGISHEMIDYILKPILSQENGNHHDFTAVTKEDALLIQARKSSKDLVDNIKEYINAKYPLIESRKDFTKEEELRVKLIQNICTNMLIQISLLDKMDAFEEAAVLYSRILEIQFNNKYEGLDLSAPKKSLLGRILDADPWLKERYEKNPNFIDYLHFDYLKGKPYIGVYIKTSSTVMLFNYITNQFEEQEPETKEG